MSNVVYFDTKEVAIKFVETMWLDPLKMGRDKIIAALKALEPSHFPITQSLAMIESCEGRWAIRLEFEQGHEGNNTECGHYTRAGLLSIYPVWIVNAVKP